MMVKVCGITRREDAEAAVEAGASALGFVFVRSSPRYVTAEQAAELGEGLPILKVGVFENQDAASLNETMLRAQLDVVQIYGGAAPTTARVWRAFRVSSAFDPSQAEGAEAVLLDGPANGISFDWSLAKTSGAKIIVAGGLDASNVAEAIRMVKPWGVDASSRLESSPGVKDHEKVRRFVAAAREQAALMDKMEAVSQA
jgi:phosphoribosylanthranilate isomerase